MHYADLVTLYFHQSDVLTTYWTVYIVVIGGLIAVAAIRRVPDVPTCVLATVLYCCFAYKNLTAIRDTTFTRLATLDSLRQIDPARTADPEPGAAFRDRVLPTLVVPDYAGVRTYHLACDALTLAALWSLQLRRLRSARRGVS